MGKKKRGGGKSSVIPHKEAFQRMNYLFQAAHAVLSRTPNQPQLSRFYIRTLKTISRRLVLKLDPSIKRTICKSCDSLLVPGVTCTHRLRTAREKHVVVTCLTCGRLKRYVSREGYLPWSEREENIVSPPLSAPRTSQSSSSSQLERDEDIVPQPSSAPKASQSGSSSRLERDKSIVSPPSLAPKASQSGSSSCLERDRSMVSPPSSALKPSQFGSSSRLEREENIEPPLSSASRTDYPEAESGNTATSTIPN